MTGYDHSEDTSFSDALELTWVKVWLHFGPQALEPTDEAVAESVSKILDRLGSRDEEGAAHRAELLQQFQNMVVTVEDFEQFCKTGFDAGRTRIGEEGQEQAVEIPASEMIEDDAAPADTDLDLTPERDRGVTEGISFLESIRQEIEAAAREHEGESAELFLETTPQEVADAVGEVTLLGDELVVVEYDENRAHLYILCFADPDTGRVLTAHVDEETGQASPGADFESYLQGLLDELPVRGGMSATEDSFMVHGPVTYLGEELVLDPDFRAVALVEMSASDLLLKSGEAGLTEPVSTIPESEGWTYVVSSAQTIIDLLGSVMRPAVIAQVTDTFHKLAFVMPGAQGSWERSVETGSWASFLTRVAGEYEDSGESGASFSLVWGAQKEILKHVPQGSEAQDMLWELPGLLPEPLLGVQKSDEVDNLTWIYGLDEGESRRLRQYVEDSEREIGMESVLQLLGLSADLMKLADGSRALGEFQELRSWEPDMTAHQTAHQALQAYPNGADRLSQVQRVFYENPWLYLAEGALHLGASGVLAARARRQFLRGQSAKTSAGAAALLAALGIADLAMSATRSRVKQDGFGVLLPDAIFEAKAQKHWFQELKEQVEKEKNREAGIVHTSQTPVHANGVVKKGQLEPVSSEQASDAERASSAEQVPVTEQVVQKAKSAAQKFLRKFF